MWFLKSETSENWCWNGILTPEECKKVIEIGEKIGTEKSKLENGNVDEKIRKNNTCFIPVNNDTRWLFEKCTYVINMVNEKYFNYDLTAISELQYTVYDKDCFYDKHIDMIYESYGIRKLSFSILLSDPSTYEGGELLLHLSNEPTPTKKELGVMTAFPSRTLHEVTPIKKGKRIALVGWVIGPKFR